MGWACIIVWLPYQHTFFYFIFPLYFVTDFYFVIVILFICAKILSVLIWSLTGIHGGKSLTWYICLYLLSLSDLRCCCCSTCFDLLVQEWIRHCALSNDKAKFYFIFCCLFPSYSSRERSGGFLHDRSSQWTKLLVEQLASSVELDQVSGEPLASSICLSVEVRELGIH